MEINNEFEIGQEVYLISDPDQYMRIVIGVGVSGYNIVYDLACGPEVSTHFEFEISATKNVI